MSKHTHGPWQADAIGSDGSFEIWSTRDMPRNEWIICSRNGIEHRAEESKANAKLIAAAPDLLEACRHLIAQLEDALVGESDVRGRIFIAGKTDLELKPDGSYLLSQARAAVAKAMGNIPVKTAEGKVG